MDPSIVIVLRELIERAHQAVERSDDAGSNSEELRELRAAVSTLADVCEQLVDAQAVFA